MRKYISYLAPFGGKITLALTIKFIGTVFDLLIPYILEHIIDNVSPTKDVKLIIFWGAVMVICSVLAVLGNIIANRRASRVSSDTVRVIRHDLFVKTIYLSCAETDKFTIPSLESRLTTDTYNVHNFTNQMLRMGVRAPILLVGGLILTATMDPVLTLVLAATLPFITVSVYFISKKSIPLYTDMQSSTDDMVRTVRENISGIRVIKALSKTQYEKKRFAGVNSKLMKSEEKAGIAVASTNPLMNFFLYAGLTVVITLGAYRVNAGVTGVGVIIAFISYFTYILNAMLSVTRIFVSYSKCAASMERITEVLDSPAELKVMTPSEGDECPEPDENAPHIEFDDVTFSYAGRTNNVENVSFKLRHGGTLGIIGATGSGKTTLISLLMRFYDPDSGYIKIDGIDIRYMDPDTLLSRFGIALQSDFLVSGTIRENVRFGRDISDEEMEEAIFAAQAKEFVESKGEGLDFKLDIKGANLSGGQKQRVVLSRALASKPEILILDDSSSALDYKTDANLRAAIARYAKDSTKIIVAQRVSSIMSSDLILVMDSGRVIASGNHDELYGSCEIYREIADSQMGGAILD